MVKKHKKDFNHNLMIVGVVGVVAIIGILITLGSGTYTGKASGIKTEQQAFYGLYTECVDMYGYRSGHSNNAALMQEIKDWCSCRVYGGYLDEEPTPDTSINWAELERPQAGRGGDCGENPLTGHVAGIEYRKIRNVKDFAKCLNKFGHVQNWDPFTEDVYSPDYSLVPPEHIDWCACRFGDVIKNFHDGNAKAIILDSVNFYGKVRNNAECGENPITGN